MGQRRNNKIIRNHFYLNDNENRIYLVLKAAIKGVLKGKCVALNIYIRKKESFKSTTSESTLKN